MDARPNRKARKASPSKTKVMKKKRYNAIVFFDPALNIGVRKYRNVFEQSFLQFIQRTGAWYVNFYDRDTRQYSHRVYIKKTPE